MKIAPYIVFTLLLFACGAPDKNENAETSEPAGEAPAQPDMHNSKIALDWDGTYTGVTPCADCEGIKTSLSLHKDETYELTTIYLGKDNEKPIHESGSFEWSADGGSIAIAPKNGSMQRYQVGENVLIHLDQEGKAITGDLAPKYRLEKVMDKAFFEGKKMEIYELMGNKVEEGMKGRPFIQFDASEKRVTGYAGCNNFFGGYTIEEGQQIRFGQMGATKMACENMTTEDRLFKALTKVDNYAVGEDGTLSLNRAKMAPLVRLRIAEEAP